MTESPNKSREARPFLVAIGGGTGSGKTTVAKGLAGRHSRIGVTLIDQDSYYRDRSHLSREERSRLNFDEPGAFDYNLLVQHLERLRGGEPVEKPRYSFTARTRTGEFDRVEPAPLIVLEGLLALWDSRIRKLAGLKIYVDADADVRMTRRLRRDVGERGRTVESVVTQYLETVRPMHRLHVEPTKAYADLVLDTTDSSLEDSMTKIDRALAETFPSLREAVGLNDRS